MAGLRLLAASALLVLAGCSSVQLPPPVWIGANDRAEDLLAGAEPTRPSLDPFALGAASRAWLHERVVASRSPTERLDALVALFGPDGPLALDYDLIASQDAEETLASGRGNCLSFTILFVALAREAGLQARVHSVPIAESWSRVGTTAVANRHVVVVGRADTRAFEVDFGHLVDLRSTPTQPLTDREVAALLESNRGAAAIAEQAQGAGLVHLRRAAWIDPALGQPWINMGVALGRHGDPAGAELAFRTALRRSPGDPAALSGLLRLYRTSGATEAAAELGARMPALLARNPYYLFGEGRRREQAGDLDGALRAYRKALRAQPDEPWFHLAVLRNRVAANDSRGVRAALRDARRQLAPDVLQALLDRPAVAPLVLGQADAALPAANGSVPSP